MAGLWQLIKPLTADITNLVINPSYEKTTTGVTAKGSNTAARSTAQQFRGLYSLKCTYQDNLTFISHDLTATGGANNTVYLKARIFVPSDWDGGDIKISGQNFTSSSEVVVTQYNDGTDPVGVWLLLETTLTLGIDTVGTIDFVISSAPTAGKFVYLDALYASLADAEYFDGDQEGCEWASSEHASVSTASAKSRSNGAIVNLDAYQTFITGQAGTGYPAINNRLRALSLQPGAEYLGADILPRIITLARITTGTTLADLHSNRKDLIDALKADLVQNEQPVKLRYLGARSGVPVEIQAVYDAGLEWATGQGFTEQGAIRLLAADPFWYSLDERAYSLAHSDTDSALNNIAVRDQGVWGNMEEGTDAGVLVMAVGPDRSLYLGGIFNAAGGDTDIRKLAKWDGANYSLLGTTPADDAVRALAVDAAGNLYAAGDFTTMDSDTDAVRVAKWNGSAWSALSTGLNNQVTDLLVGRDGYLYAAGAFTDAGGDTDASYFAKWDGSAWSAVGTGLNNVCTSLAQDKNGNIYIGGTFTATAAGDTDAAYIVKWDGAAYSALSTGMNNYVRALTIAENGLLYLGGDFTTAGGISAAYAAVWNGSTFAAVGDFQNSVYEISIYKQLVYFSGTFTDVGGDTDFFGIAVWNGSTFAHIDLDPPGSPGTLRLTVDKYGVEPIYYFAWSSTGTGQYGDQTTVTNPGTAAVFPQIIFDGTAALKGSGDIIKLRYIKNETTGHVIWLDYEMVGGERLTLDLRQKKKTVRSNLYGNVSGAAVLPQSDLAAFKLLPGANVISVFAILEGSATLAAHIKFRPAYWSHDGIAA